MAKTTKAYYKEPSTYLSKEARKKFDELTKKNKSSSPKKATKKK